MTCDDAHRAAVDDYIERCRQRAEEDRSASAALEAAAGELAAQGVHVELTGPPAGPYTITLTADTAAELLSALADLGAS